MSCYASQINRLDILIRRKHQAGAIPGDSTPAEPAKAIAGILEAYDLIIRQLGQWPDHLIWPPGPVVALHAARRRLQDTLCSVARRHPASNPCTRPDQIAADLDEMCADRQRMATCPPTAHSHPARLNASSPGHEPSSVTERNRFHDAATPTDARGQAP
jgi:hypothetical protein